MNNKITKIQTHLWFDSQAEEAVHFYSSIFKNFKIGKISHYTESGQEFHGKPIGSVMTIEFSLEGQEFVALNGGTYCKFSEAISIVVNCDTQEEVDYLWEKLTSGGGEESHCGWLKDKYGLSWQIIPKEFYNLAEDSDCEKSKRVIDAMYTMKKLDLNVFKKAYNES